MEYKGNRVGDENPLAQNKPILHSAGVHNPLFSENAEKQTIAASGKMGHKTEWFRKAADLYAAADVASDNVFLSLPYLSALEQGGPSDAEYHYALLKSGKKVLGFYYFQLLPFRFSALEDMIRDKPYRRLLQTVKSLLDAYLFRTSSQRKSVLLVCGNMCVSGDHGLGGVHKTTLSELLPGVLQELLRSIGHTHRVIAQVVKDAPESNDPFGAALKSKRFFALDMDPVMKLFFPQDVTDLERYKAALSSKYRVRMNQTRKRIEDCEWRDLSLVEMKRYRDTMQALYKAVQDKAPLKIVQVNMDYLLALKKNLDAGMRCSALFSGDRMLAFTTGILNGEEYEAHHIGLDYDENRNRSLYLNILFRYIEMALDANAKSVCFGRTALEMKTTVGAVPVYFNAYMKLSNGFLNGFVRCLLPDPAPHNWIPRSPFR